MITNEELEQGIKWIFAIHPSAKYWDHEQLIDAYLLYRSYREDGQTSIVARQYAGLI